jgi:hypothetical protein
MMGRLVMMRAHGRRKLRRLLRALLWSRTLNLGSGAEFSALSGGAAA